MVIFHSYVSLPEGMHGGASYDETGMILCRSSDPKLDKGRDFFIPLAHEIISMVIVVALW